MRFFTQCGYFSSRDGTYSWLDRIYSMAMIELDGERLLAECDTKKDAELFARLERFRGEESESLAQTLACLATLDRRKAADELADGSLFLYCTRKLGYSEAEAYMRIRVARAANDFPRILTMIGRGQIHVSAVARIAPYLDSENYRSLLGKASRRSREELDRLIAELEPQIERRPVIRSLSVGNNARAPIVTAESLFEPPSPQLHSSFSQSASGRENKIEMKIEPWLPTAVPDNAGACSVRPPAGRVLFSFVGSEAFRAKYKRAKEILLHKYPDGSPEKIFDDALEALLDKKDPWRRLARKERRRAMAGSEVDSS